MDRESALREAAGWPGVEAGAGELRYAGRLLGRETAAGLEIALPKGIAAMLVETGRAEPHDDPRLVRFAGDADEAVELFRLAYERARVAERVRRTASRPASDPG